MSHTLSHLGTAVLAVLVFSPTALAQMPGAAFPPMVPGPPGSALPGVISPDGNGGGFGSRVVFGTVKGVDVAAGTLSITSPMGGQAETVKVDRGTQIVREALVTAADLKIGDQVQVSGIPTQITASQIVATQAAAAPGMKPDRPEAGGRTGDVGSGPTGQAFATVDAHVLQVSPLLLSLGNGVTVGVKIDPQAKISRVAPTSLSNVKVGDPCVASGQTGNGGTFTASSIRINLNAGDSGFGAPPMMSPDRGAVGTQIVPNGE